MTLTEKIRGKLASILSPHFLGREQEALVELAGATLDEAQVMIDEGDAGLQEQLNTLKSEYGAGLIGIEDVADNFVSFNVEGALLELAERDILSDDATVTGKWDFAQDIGFVRNGFTAELSVTSLSDDRTYTLKDASGTLAFLSDIPPQLNLVAGSNINITGTYPNLTISGTGGGGGTGVTTVNGMVGDVVLDYSDVGAAPTSHTHTIAQVSGLQAALDGKAASSHTHSADDITSGTIARARLGSGTANSDNFLRGDGVWAVPPTGTGGGGGTVTSVQVAGGTGLSFTGGPITTSGTITGSLSTNLQSWSGISPSSKANSSVSVTAGNGLSGGGTLASSRTITLAPPESVTLSSTNSVGTSTHTHAFAPGGTTAQYIRGNGSLATFPTSMTPTAHTHAAGDITSGTFSIARIPSLSSLYVTTSGNQTGIGGNKTFTGNITAANVTATSDVRLKEDIEACPGRKKLLEALRHYRWKWKESGEPGIGVLAQEVQKHAPEYVHEDEEGVLSVDKAGLALEMMFAMIDVLEEFDGSSN